MRTIPAVFAIAGPVRARASAAGELLLGRADSRRVRQEVEVVMAMVFAAASMPACARGLTAASTKSREWIAIPVGAMATIGWIVGSTWLTLPTSEEPSRSGIGLSLDEPRARSCSRRRGRGGSGSA